MLSDMTLVTGRMRKLPDWITQGVVLGLQGGQDKVVNNYNILKENGVPIAAVWMQDWVGTKEFPEGVRLMWNWKLNREFYPEWDSMIANWTNDGVKAMVYINPYFANLTDVSITRNLFLEGDSQGFFIKNGLGKTYMMKSVSIEFAMLDPTNPYAVNWMKQIIKENLLGEGQAWGWMHDFGEYMPITSTNEIVLYSGEDSMVIHNKYPEMWARLNREAESEAGKADTTVAFMRSGGTMSPGVCDLAWMGDQLPTYDKFDGLQSAMMGLLNGGLSGFSLGHSDIGGYTSLNKTLDSLNFSIFRTKELLLRWIEMSTYSDVIMRTHPSNKPVLNYQVFSDNNTAQFLAFFVNQHVKLGPYKRQLIAEAASTGVPVTRSLFLNYPLDLTARKIVDQFMLGDHVLMAPIFKEGQMFRTLYLPEGSWRHIWTDVVYLGPKQVTVYSPLGQPAVFFSTSWKMSQSFISEKLQEISM